MLILSDYPVAHNKISVLRGYVLSILIRVDQLVEVILLQVSETQPKPTCSNFKGLKRKLLGAITHQCQPAQSYRIENDFSEDMDS